MRLSDATTTRWRWNSRGRSGKQTHKNKGAKSRQLLRYYRTQHGRHPQKLIMNPAYDLHSVDLYCSKKPKTAGGKSLHGGSEDEEEDPPDVLEVWQEGGSYSSRPPCT